MYYIQNQRTFGNMILAVVTGPGLPRGSTTHLQLFVEGTANAVALA